MGFPMDLKLIMAGVCVGLVLGVSIGYTMKQMVSQQVSFGNSQILGVFF